MHGIRHHAFAASLVLVLAAASTARASGDACATEKFGDENFQERLAMKHDGVIVRLDVDATAFMREAAEHLELPETRRQALLRDSAERLLAEKRARLEGTRFTIHHDVDAGPQVVVLVDGMDDVCELAANPHVEMIWVNVASRVRPVVFTPARPSSGGGP